MTIAEFIIRLGLAFALGALVGIERQWRQKSAGLRTNTLVSLGSAAFILLSLSLTDGAGDPSRVAGQIVTGIGFLGGGVILKTGMNIQGLNTAATIWCSAAVGTLAGAGLYIEASLTAVAITAAHTLLRPISAIINRLPTKREESGIMFYMLKIRCREQVENHLRVLMLNEIKKNDQLQLRSLKSTDDGSPAYSYVEAEIMANVKSDGFMEAMAGKLTLEYGVTQVSWSVSGTQTD